MTHQDDGLLYSVDRSWGRYSGSSEGDLIKQTKFHRVNPETGLAKCSSRILLNNLAGDGAGEKLSDLGAAEICRRCEPRAF